MRIALVALLLAGGVLLLWWTRGPEGTGDVRPEGASVETGPDHPVASGNASSLDPLGPGEEELDRGELATEDADRRPPGEAEGAGPDTRRRMRLRVVDDAGARLESADVRATVDGEPLVRTTDPGGECHLPLARDTLILEVEKEGYFHRRGHYALRDELELPLSRLADLRARVVTAETGAPLPGAEVTFHHPCKGCEPQRVRTDAAGGVLLEGLPCGQTLRVEVQAPGFGKRYDNFTIPSPAPTLERTIQLERSVELRGRIVDSLTGQPVEGAALWPSGPELDGAGFTLPVVPDEAGRYSMRVVAPEHCQVRGNVAVDEPVEVPMVRGGFVTGAVRDAGGRPLPGVRVSFRVDHRTTGAARDALPSRRDLLPDGWTVESGGGRFARTETDEDGAYRSPGLTPFELHTVHVREEGYYPVNLAVPAFEGPGDVVHLDVALEPLPEVTLVPWRGRLLLNGEGYTGRIEWTFGDRRGSTEAASDGSFTFDGVPAGTLTVRAYPKERFGRGDFSRVTESQEIEVPVAKEFVHDIEVEVSVAPIAGVVLDATGRPEEGRTVWTSSDSGSFYSAQETGPEGTFRFLVPREFSAYAVGVHHPTAGAIVEGIPPGREDLEFRLQATGTLRVRVVDEKGLPAVACHLYLLDATSGSYQRITELSKQDVGGWVEEVVPVGSLDLMVRTVRGGSVLTAHTTIQDGEVRELSFDLPPTVSLEFLLAEGSEEGGRTVHLVPEKDSAAILARLARDKVFFGGSNYSFPDLAHARVRRLQFDAGGRGLVEGLAPGTWVLVPSLESHGVEPATVEVTLEDSQPRTILVRKNP